MFTSKNCILLVRNQCTCLKRLLFINVYSKFNWLIDRNFLKCIIYPMQIRFLVTSKCAQNLPTSKGWKSLVRDGQKEDFMPFKPPVSCEEGTGAIPHFDLMKVLQECNTVADQIKTFSSVMSMTPQDVENRKEFCKSLVEIFRPYFSEFKVHLFGSSINGLGFKGCDADVSIQTIFSEKKEYLSDIKEVPTLDSVINGETSTDTIAHLPPRLLLRFVRRILRKHCSDIKEPILLIKARCPLLRFYNTKYDLFCDFSCENYASLRNTKVIRLLCHLDERFVQLTKFIRYWGKYGGFVGDLDMFNSYAFSLLIVHFLQCRDPPVLPPIQELIEKSEYLRHGDVNDDDLLLREVKKFQSSKNTESIENLLREYFFHFLKFDYSHVMVPASGSTVHRVDFVPDKDNSSDCFVFSAITVQDPFRLNFNTTTAANFKSCKRFLNGLVEACSKYQDQSVWNSATNNWGVCSLFQRRISESEMHKKWEKNCVHSIQLPHQVKADFVKNILEQCLLFDCSELLFPKNSESPLLKLNCRAYHNTWQGRQFLYKSYPQSLTDPLEIENWISREMLKKKEDNRRILFTFICECFQSGPNEELNVVLTFRESRFPPVVAIFLKEYIPEVCKKFLKNA